ncbi:hypothetical protein ADIS_0850 [Lunatimonas lonarensis]|uniref:Uncharacterized protein n=1 Tax=Lunatimonas lonarensis TaxID=1232681 RepID=R7ZX01_9BACT|nr:hypothetical protein ADIS_0850 [Lunatimonas lonarensis]
MDEYRFNGFFAGTQGVDPSPVYKKTPANSPVSLGGILALPAMLDCPMARYISMGLAACWARPIDSGR